MRLLTLLAGFALIVAACGDGDDASAERAYAGFDYESNFAELDDGLRMHYLDEGDGDPIVMVHGLPTQAYLWRNVIPEVVDNGRVLAVDLLNFGLSDKTDPLTPQQHSERLGQFIDALDLEDVTLVLHDWGVAIGLNYAATNPDNVKAIAFFEGPFGPFPDVTTAPPGFLERVASPESESLIVDQNFFIDCFLLDPSCGGAVYHEYTDAEREVYRAPFLDPADRDQIVILPRYLPFLDTTGHPFYDPDGPGGEAAQPVPEIEMYLNFSQYLQSDDVPKLFIHGVPGALPNGDQIAVQLQSTYANLRTASVGSASNPVGHYIQEDAPEDLGRTISEFLDQL